MSDERVYKLAGALLAASPTISAERALRLAEKIVRVVRRWEEAKHEANRPA